jgi:RNA polymerase sigma factor (sigma-70 family)
MTLGLPISRVRTLVLLLELRGPVTDAARNRIESEIIMGHERLCLWHARRYQNHGVDLEDLLAEARAALLTAIRRFDARRDTSFTAYAYRCLRQALLRAVRRQGAPVAVPRTEAVTQRGVALDHQPDSVSERMLGPSDDDPAADALLRVDAARLSKLVDLLPDREAVVVRLRFGLAGCAAHELAEIGALIGVTKQRVQAILDKALATLRGQLTTKKAA